jgi:hypothetical protein
MIGMKEIHERYLNALNQIKVNNLEEYKVALAKIPDEKFYTESEIDALLELLRTKLAYEHVDGILKYNTVTYVNHSLDDAFEMLKKGDLNV